MLPGLLAAGPRGFFTEELARAGMVFRQDLPVVCEEFVKVYSQPT